MSFILLGILNAQASGVEAGGPYDLLETTVLGSDTASVSFTGLGAYSGYKHLQIRSVSRASGSGGFENVMIRFNSDSGNNYARHQLRGDGDAGNVTGGWSLTSQPQIELFWHSLGGAADADDFGAFVMDILDFSSTSKNTTTRSFGGAEWQGDVTIASGLYNSTSAITSLEIFADVASFEAGSRFSLYGIGTPELAGA